MDKILAELIENEVEAEGRLDFSDTDFEYRVCSEVVRYAKALTNAYITYKKLEEDYNNAIESRNRYYNAVQEVDRLKEGN